MFAIQFRLLSRWTRKPIGPWHILEAHSNYETEIAAQNTVDYFEKQGEGRDLRQNISEHRIIEVKE